MSPRAPTVGFICAASADIGGGHVMRCLTLALALERRGFFVRFAVNGEAPRTVPALERTGFPITILDHIEDAKPGPSMAGWQEIDCIVFDGYGLGEHVENRFRGAARLVAIDDLADRRHDCDLLIDSGPARLRSDYVGLLPASATIVTGPRYALLREEFARQRQAALSRRAGRPGNSQTLMVSLGLTDVGGLTAPIVTEIVASRVPSVVEVLIGSRAASRAALETLAATDDRVRVHIDAPDVAAIMARADVAIGAGGTSSLERCCLGLPALMIVLADNQLPNSHALAEVAAARVLPRGVEPAAVAQSALDLLSDQHALRLMSEAAAALVDGRGAERVTLLIESLIGGSVQRCATMPAMRLRPAVEGDSDVLRSWRNDEVTRFNSVDTAVVPRDVHERWFAGILKKQDCLLLIGQSGDERVGMVRFDASPGEETTRCFAVSIAVAPESRSKGVGTQLLMRGCSEVVAKFGASVLKAVIRSENVASCQLFERCGFSRDGGACDEGFVSYRRKMEN